LKDWQGNIECDVLPKSPGNNFAHIQMCPGCKNEASISSGQISEEDFFFFLKKRD
jgi:hypothetical protein